MVHHIVIIPAALSLLPLRGAAVGHAPSILLIDPNLVLYQILQFFNLPVFSAASIRGLSFTILLVRILNHSVLKISNILLPEAPCHSVVLVDVRLSPTALGRS